MSGNTGKDQKEGKVKTTEELGEQLKEALAKVQAIADDIQDEINELDKDSFVEQVGPNKWAIKKK